MEDIKSSSVKVEIKLPQKLGQKSFDPTKEDIERLNSFLTEYEHLLATERKINKRKVSVVEYNESNFTLTVKTIKGSYWNYYGFTDKTTAPPQTLLHPEEALYLQECGVLEIVSTGGGPWSIQKTYHTLLRCKDQDQLLLNYQVYANLKRGGYIVQIIKEDLLHHLYIVYKPRKSFKKSLPGQPDFVIIVTRPSDPLPSLEEINKMNILYPSSELQYAVVIGNDINYYSLHKMTSLPLPQF